MATFYIVDEDKDPLGPNEINSGETINASNGDIFVVTASADSDIRFESASGNATNFEIRFEADNSNEFEIDIQDDLDAGIVVSSGVDISDVSIDAKDALSVIMTAGDNVSMGAFTGSNDGVDVVTIGDGFSTQEDIRLNGGDNFLSIGDNASIENIIAGSGDDTITIGDGLSAEEIQTGSGDDSLTIGDGAELDEIKTGKGDDTIVIGDGLELEELKTGSGEDAVTIGDNATVDEIDTGKGDDTITIGDNFTGEELETKGGNDHVTIGIGGSIDDLNGGGGTDTLSSPTSFPDATNFEIICFARGTYIETVNGEIPIEDLRAGDQIETMDNGQQPIRWIGSTRVPGQGVHAPVRIAAGALGNARTLWVSQQHRMLLTGWEPELFFGEKEVLVPAKHLLGWPGVKIVGVASVEYFHMLFDQHEIVFAEGIESESFHPGAQGMNTLDEFAREEILGLFPELDYQPSGYGPSARLSLRSFEARILVA